MIVRRRWPTLEGLPWPQARVAPKPPLRLLSRPRACVRRAPIQKTKTWFTLHGVFHYISVIMYDGGSQRLKASRGLRVARTTARSSCNVQRAPCPDPENEDMTTHVDSSNPWCIMGGLTLTDANADHAPKCCMHVSIHNTQVLDARSQNSNSGYLHLRMKFLWSFVKTTYEVSMKFR